MNSGSSFAVYCSQGASRVIKFFSHSENRINYAPKIVIYDGEDESVIERLKHLFSERLIIFDKKTLSFESSRRIHSETSYFIQHSMLSNEVEFLLCFGNKILKKPLIDAYPNKLINFHPSLLPSFKGLSAIDQALSYGVAILGNTAHYIDESIDTGKIIVQAAMYREDFKDYEDVLELQFPMIKLVLRDLLGYEVASDKLFEELKHREASFIIPKKCNTYM